MAIVEKVCALRGFQEHLAVDAPQDPRRAFGEAVEGGPSLASAVQLLERALPPVLEKLADKFCIKIDERFAAMERLRLGPYAPVGAGSSNPLTIPQYLNEREREHPGFAGIRKRDRFAQCDLIHTGSERITRRADTSRAMSSCVVQFQCVHCSLNQTD